MYSTAEVKKAVIPTGVLQKEKENSTQHMWMPKTIMACKASIGTAPVSARGSKMDQKSAVASIQNRREFLSRNQSNANISESNSIDKK